MGTAEVEISRDRARLDVTLVHTFLTNAYWCKGISRGVVEQAIAGSECFGLYRAAAQIGFARLVTDRATFAYLCDVFVIDSERGRGHGKTLVAHVLEVARSYDLRRTLLATADAHTLYARHGFEALAKPESFMEINRPGIYLSGRPGNQQTK